ncbi:hypothetical protein ACP70R_016132 [Stipagrostis hirtigluma subsp. patula]
MSIVLNNCCCHCPDSKFVLLWFFLSLFFQLSSSSPKIPARRHWRSSSLAADPSVVSALSQSRVFDSNTHDARESELQNGNGFGVPISSFGGDTSYTALMASLAPPFQFNGPRSVHSTPFVNTQYNNGVDLGANVSGYESGFSGTGMGIFENGNDTEMSDGESSDNQLCDQTSVGLLHASVGCSSGGIDASPSGNCDLEIIPEDAYELVSDQQNKSTQSGSVESQPKALGETGQRHSDGDENRSIADNGTVMGAIEKAMRRTGDWTKEFIFQPSLGMTFPSLGDAYQFYNLYSWEVGFSIRKKTNQHSKKLKEDGEKELIMQEYCCQRAGKQANCKYSTTMIGCQARFRLIKKKEDEWYVSMFEQEHNHDLVESCGEKRHLHSHQSIDQGTKDMVRYLRENNISVGKVNCIIGSMHGSVDNLPFSKKQLKRVCSSIAADLMINDMGKTMQLFCDMKDNDPDFVYAFQLDEASRVTSLMWSTGHSRRMYSHFGDVVTFDTTYKTNIYEMPFGMFVGVNNHFQSVIFAGVLLTNEETESFKWAFKNFKKMMGGKKPITILTDQCAAMGAAIREVMDGVAHRWCKWHVLKKLVEVLGHLFNKHKEFQNDFNKVVNHMLTQEEFEDAWKHMAEKYNLADNAEIIRAFECRSMWAKPWFKDIFCARMCSTQRSESLNAVLKSFVPRHSPMNQFVHKYTSLILEQQKADAEAEKNTKQRVRQVRYGWLIEEHAALIYTKESYGLFIEEISKIPKFVFVETDIPNQYKAVHARKERVEKWCKPDYTVNVDPVSSTYTCECGLYSHFGILCTHALLVMVNKGVHEIPPCHIMKRWTTKAREGQAPHLKQLLKPKGPLDSKFFRRNTIDSICREVANLTCSDKESFDYVLKELVALKKKGTRKS